MNIKESPCKREEKNEEKKTSKSQEQEGFITFMNVFCEKWKSHIKRFISMYEMPPAYSYNLISLRALCCVVYVINIYILASFQWHNNPLSAYNNEKSELFPKCYAICNIKKVFYGSYKRLSHCCNFITKNLCMNNKYEVETFVTDPHIQ